MRSYFVFNKQSDMIVVWISVQHLYRNLTIATDSIAYTHVEILILQLLLIAFVCVLFIYCSSICLLFLWILLCRLFDRLCSIAVSFSYGEFLVGFPSGCFFVSFVTTGWIFYIIGLLVYVRI